MWTTSNSRVERRRLPWAAAFLVLTACSGPGSSRAPDAPRPARDPSILGQPPGPVTAPARQDRPVELRSARVVAVRSDSLLERLAGPALLGTARNPLAIEVITAEPLGDVARSSSVEIYLNGERLGNTWPLPPDRLVLILPDAQRLRAPLEITVAWVGSEERTRSRRALVIPEDQLRPFR